MEPVNLNDNNPINFCSCDSMKKYSDEYDAYYCELCNKWTEDKCDDPTCEFCTKRPSFPN